MWKRLLRVNRLPSSVRFVIGGWSTLVHRLERHARMLGVVVETGARVDALPDPPVIVATELDEARRLTGDESVRWESVHAVLLDVGLRAVRGEPYLLYDPLAPPGHDLIQAVMGRRPGEDAGDTKVRLENLLDAGFKGWRRRQVWSRRQVMDGRHGALDLPGTSWRDRPAVDRGDGVFVACDTVAAPGLLSEVALNGAIEASRGALSWQKTCDRHARGNQGRRGRPLLQRSGRER